MKIIASEEHSTYVNLPKVWSCNWNYKGNLIVSGGENKKIKIWNYSKGKNSSFKKI